MPTEETLRSVLQNLQSTYSLRGAHILGSYADGRATSQSALDLLVEFDRPAVSLISLTSLKYDLEEQLGLPEDVVHFPLPADSMIQPQKVVSFAITRNLLTRVEPADFMQ